MMKSLCVYCGSHTGESDRFAEAAEAIGRALAERGIALVYGGGQVGLMGLAADACLDAGGHVIGVIPDFLHRKEIAHPRVPDMRIVTSMHERKQIMSDLAGGFLALPGGIGTMEELFEAWTWSQLGRHAKPVGLLNVGGYFDGLLTFLDTMRSEGFIAEKHRDMLLVGDGIDALLDRLEAYEHPGAIDHLTRAQT
jgi:uncharacterized protein (TIGR00730 family)